MSHVSISLESWSDEDDLRSNACAMRLLNLLQIVKISRVMSQAPYYEESLHQSTTDYDGNSISQLFVSRSSILMMWVGCGLVVDSQL